jgi:hypothetical protein
MTQQKLQDERFGHYKLNQLMLEMDKHVDAMTIVQAIHAPATGVGKLLSALSEAFDSAYSESFSEEYPFSFAGQADGDLIHAKLKQHYTDIFKKYGMPEATIDKVIQDFTQNIKNRIITTKQNEEGWRFHHEKALTQHVLTHCRHSESEEDATDTFFSILNHDQEHLMANLNSISDECLQAMFQVLERRLDVLKEPAGERLATSLAIRSIMANRPVPQNIFMKIMDFSYQQVSNMLIFIPTDFDLSKISGDALQQFAQLLIISSKDPHKLALSMLNAQYGKYIPDPATFTDAVNAGRNPMKNAQTS